MEEDFDDETMDACLIASGQRAEHYEMAAYGTLVAWAEVMGHTEAVELLSAILDEEKAADKKLTALAEGGINQSASEGAMDEDDAVAADAGGEEPASSASAKASAGGKAVAARTVAAKR